MRKRGGEGETEEESHSPKQVVVSSRSQRRPPAMMPREEGKPAQKEQSSAQMMMTHSSVSGSSLSSNSACKARGSNSFFSLPGLFIGFTKGGTPDSDPARSPTSPLDCKVFSSLGSYLARSPRSPHCDRVGLGLVDALSDEAITCVRVLSSATSPTSLPKNYMISSPTRVGLPLRRRSPLETAPELPGARLLEPEKPGETQPSSTDMDRSFLASQNLNIVRRMAVGSSSGSLPVNTYGCVGSLSAGDIEQSEDYTRIISCGPNPKTTHIFGDFILESHASHLSDIIADKQGVEGRETSWMVMCSEDPMTFPSEDFLRVCYSCKKKLDGKDIYMFRGEKAFCSCSCRSQEILVEEEMEEPAGGSSASTGSASCEEIFFPGMDVAT